VVLNFGGSHGAEKRVERPRQGISAERHQGRRNLWLRTLDRMGLGFDS
jgi:hypothetical protein